MTQIFIMGFSLYQIIYYFFIYSFLGWILETIYVSYLERRFVNRGFMNGSYCPIYGVGMCFILLLFSPYSDHYALVFFGGLFLATALEYFTGWILETLFGARWWDYSKHRFNLKGRISLTNSIIWGLLILATVEVIQPQVERFVLSIPQAAGIAVISGVGGVMLLDLIYSLYGASQFSLKLKSLARIRNELRSVLEQSELFESMDELRTEIMSDGFFKILGETSQKLKLRLADKSITHLDNLQTRIAAIEEKYHYQINRIGLNENRFLNAYPTLAVKKTKHLVHDIRDTLSKKRDT